MCNNFQIQPSKCGIFEKLKICGMGVSFYIQNKYMVWTLVNKRVYMYQMHNDTMVCGKSNRLGGHKTLTLPYNVR